MKIEDQVVSLELAKEMKELGLREDSWISWIYYSHESLYGMSEEEISRDIEFEWGFDCELCHNVDHIEKYAAPTVAELGEMLPFNCHSYKDEFDGWECVFSIEGEKTPIIGDTIWGPIAHARQCRVSEEAKTEADARAKMWIYLKKRLL